MHSAKRCPEGLHASVPLYSPRTPHPVLWLSAGQAWSGQDGWLVIFMPGRATLTLRLPSFRFRLPLLVQHQGAGAAWDDDELDDLLK